LGFQNFEGISFDITTRPTNSPVVPGGTGAFINDGTTIIENPVVPNPVNPGEYENSNFSEKSIQADIIELDADKESLFYIIK